ncbi:MAG: glycosyltransferase family 2 protein [Bacteroidales bacterium]|nr:glycosyltransferase family 2 protein [Lentimicrobiaceae bacterium]MDD5694671.1 glycosyltransferase family 2 protein [Bacteroidales bacterium]
MSSPDYSVIIPVFNSEDTLQELFDRLKSVFDENNATFEVIFVDDGSPDNSWDVLIRLKNDHPDVVTAIRLARNSGQHNATFCGMVRAKGNFMITIDDDLQIPPEEITALIRKYADAPCDIVYGVYPDKRHNTLRNISSSSFRLSSRMFHDGPGKGSSFRLLTRELTDHIIHHYQSFVFLDELINWYTADIAYTDIQHHQRKNKKSGYSPRKLARFVSNIILYYSNIPLKMMVYTGLVFSVFSFFIGILYIIKKIFFNVSVPGYTSTIVVIAFSTGIIVFSLGIIGEYLSRIYFSQSRKPPYTIKKIL